MERLQSPDFPVDLDERDTGNLMMKISQFLIAIFQKDLPNVLWSLKAFSAVFNIKNEEVYNLFNSLLMLLDNNHQASDFSFEELEKFANSFIGALAGLIKP